ncbi:MAG: hypothetical protein M3032_13515 [Verrucomicrobiota bacterium]|nr:hypothetical protein [Verrucomicrobiota bacterium]
MSKRVTLPVIAFFGLALLQARAADSETNISAGELRQTGEIDVSSALALDRSDLFSTVDGSLLLHTLPALTLLDGRRFPISGDLARMGVAPVDLFPLTFLHAVKVTSGTKSIEAGSDAVGGTVDLRLKRFETGGEVGVFYGKSSGRYGREDFETYLVGGIATDKVQITAGASYRETTSRGPRRP